MSACLGCGGPKPPGRGRKHCDGCRHPFCACGCGARVPTPGTTYIFGHQNGRPPGPEFFEDPETHCWLWLKGTNSRGYPFKRDGGRRRSAHRVYYEDLVGPVPPGLDLDHLCRRPLCVNPGHVDPCTRTANSRRGRKARREIREAALQEAGLTPAAIEEVLVL